MTARVLFYVQHLLGIGHLTRAATLARAMAARGMEVTIVSGGMPVEVLDRRGFDLIQLPPLRAADRTFSGLVDAASRPAAASHFEARRAQLLDAEARVRPDVVLIELFPFGRRQLAGEIVALIEAARARRLRPRILCSVRDILVEKDRPDVDAEMAASARRWFDAVLVHGDPAFVPFDATFPRARDIADLIHYTGYVVETAGNGMGNAGQGEVIVSIGSGATGEALLRAAIAARPLTPLAHVPWRLLLGSAMAPLELAAPDGVIIERARPDFRTLLANCALSISQGGYNTVMEVLAAGARAVVVPYGGGNETEQTLRARLLADRGLVQQVVETDLTPHTLAEAVQQVLSIPRTRPSLDRNGARKTADFVARMMALAV
jgi:predicted glycosyltransferase